MKRVIGSSYVQAGTRKTYDADGLKSAIFKLFEVALSRSEFSECELNITSIKVIKRTRPVCYLARVSYELTGDVLPEYDSCSKTIYDIPMNQKITEDHYLSDEHEINEIVAHFQDHYILKDHLSDLSEVWKQYKLKLSNKAQELSDKYNVKLESAIWPKEPRNQSATQSIYFQLDIVSIDLPEGVTLTQRRNIGHNCFNIEYGDISKFINYQIDAHDYHPGLDLDSILNSLEAELKTSIADIHRTADLLVSIVSYTPELEQWLDDFIENYQSQYPGLSYTNENNGSIIIKCDPNVSVGDRVDWLAMQDDPNYLKRFTKSLLGKLKRKVKANNADDDNYRDDSTELITL